SAERRTAAGVLACAQARAGVAQFRPAGGGAGRRAAPGHPQGAALSGGAGNPRQRRQRPADGPVHGRSRRTGGRPGNPGARRAGRNRLRRSDAAPGAGGAVPVEDAGRAVTGPAASITPPGSHMFGIHDFLLFLGAGLLLNITPGADMLYVLSNAARGSRAGLLAACGIFTGTLFHIAFAVAGLSALLAASATAFTVVKYVGAAYLVYLGAKMLLERSDKTGAVPDSPGQRSLLRTYRQGTLINLLNPKVALFFLA